MTLGIKREGLAQPPARGGSVGVPILATCAGLILLDREHLAVLDMRAERNAFGRQVRSFEADVTLDGFGEPLHAVSSARRGSLSSAPALSRSARLRACDRRCAPGRFSPVAFHPELAGETRLHRWLIEQATAVAV